MNIGSGLDCDAIHDDAICQLDLLLDLAVRPDAAVLDRRLVRDQTLLSNQTLGAKLSSRIDFFKCCHSLRVNLLHTVF